MKERKRERERERERERKKERKKKRKKERKKESRKKLQKWSLNRRYIVLFKHLIDFIRSFILSASEIKIKATEASQKTHENKYLFLSLKKIFFPRKQTFRLTKTE